MNLRRSLAFFSLPCAVALGAATGCDGQATPAYQGEPLATVQGKVVDDAEDPSPAGEVMLLWQTLEDATFVGSTAPVSGSFPADFTMPIYTPPPSGAQVSDAEEGLDQVGFAYILVVKQGTVVDGSEEFDPSSVLGFAEDNIVAYVGGSMAADGRVAQRIGGALPHGYSLLAVHRPTAEEKAVADMCSENQEDSYQACVDACHSTACENQCGDDAEEHPCPSLNDTLHPTPGGFDTPITVRLGDPDAKPPNWN